MQNYRIVGVERLFIELKEFIEIYFIDVDVVLKESLLEYLFQELHINAYQTPYLIPSERFAWFMLVICLKDKKITNLNWSFICNLHNIDLVEEGKKYEDYYRDKRKFKLVTYLLISIHTGEGTLGWIRFYDILNAYYRFLHSSCKYSIYKNIADIKEYYHLLVKTNRAIRFVKEDKEYQRIYKTIISNFPIDSMASHFIQSEYINSVSGNVSIVNFNTSTDNEFIKKILLEFISTYNKSSQLMTKDIKNFIYYFNQSLGNKVLESYEEFDDDIFDRQYRFYVELDCKMREIGMVVSTRKHREVFIAFYRNLTNIVNKDQNLKLFTPQFTQAINLKSFYKYYDGGFEFLYHNQLESPPLANKICILPSFQEMQNSDSGNNKLMSIDLTKVNERYREDIRHFYWYTDGYLRALTACFHILIEFLDLRIFYKELNENISCIYNAEQKEFPRDFLWEYRNQVELKVEESTTLKNWLKVVRKFLKHHAKKYNLAQTDLDILTLKNLDKFYGGRPIKDNDLNLLFKEFEKRQGEFENGRLYTIIFEIFANSSLRIGEILNLQRKCYDKKTSKIYFLSKTGKKQKISRMISREIISLLEEAEKLTEGYVIDKDLMSQFIFIKPCSARHVEKNMRIDFYTHFNLIQEGIIDQLENKGYTPYNIRHTYIDTAYKQGVENGLSLLRISKVTNQSYRTSRLYYREYNSIDLYVEALSRVTISDVDINGNILRESTGHYNKPVKKDLGECDRDHCTFEIGECLLCKHFFTFLNRIPAFKQMILGHNKRIEETTNKIEIEEINMEKKLLGRYLADMLLMSQNLKGGDINEE